MKEIPLTQGKVALVDDKDFEYLNQWKWHTQKIRNHKGQKPLFYAMRSIKNEDGKIVANLMHVEILGKELGCEVDHRDGNGLNNLRNNLRHLTHRQNCQNLHIKKTSKYPGVCWYKQKKRWRAQIRFNGKKVCLGTWTDEEEAFLGYCKGVKELTGEEVLFPLS